MPSQMRAYSIPTLRIEIGQYAEDLQALLRFGPTLRNMREIDFEQLFGEDGPGKYAKVRLPWTDRLGVLP